MEEVLDAVAIWSWVIFALDDCSPLMIVGATNKEELAMSTGFGRDPILLQAV